MTVIYKVLCVFPDDRCLGPLLTAHLRREAPGLWIRSATLAGMAYLPAHPNAMLVGVGQGVDLWNERSRTVDDSLCDWADRILVWQAKDLEQMATQWAQHRHKLQRLPNTALLPTPWMRLCDEDTLRKKVPVIRTLASLWAKGLTGSEARTAEG
jgi:protein-tyrosine phosphatase